MSKRLQETSRELAKSFAERLNTSNTFDVATDSVPAIVDLVQAKTGLRLNRDERAMLATVAFTTEADAQHEDETLAPLIILATNGIKDHPDMANNISRHYHAKALGFLSLFIFEQPSGPLGVAFPCVNFEDQGRKPLTSLAAMHDAFVPLTEHMPGISFVDYNASTLLRDGRIIRQLKAA